MPDKRRKQDKPLIIGRATPWNLVQTTVLSVREQYFSSLLGPMVRFLLPLFLLLLAGCSWEYRYRQEAERISDWDLSATCWAHSINLSGKEQCMDDLAAPELELCITSLSSKRSSIFAHKNKNSVLQCMEQKGWVRGVYMFVHGA